MSQLERPKLDECDAQFHQCLWCKYNNDARVFLVHLGLYGMWGEWHIGEVENIRPEFEMTEANRLLIANAYINAFPDKVLLARYPEHMPDPQAFGYSDGLFFEESISTTNPFYFHNILKAYHSDQAWRLHPVGGEISPPIQATIWDHFPNQLGQDVYQCFDSIHPTWLFSHHVFTALAPNTQEWDNAIRAQKAMGYTFYVEKSRFSATNGKPSIEVNFHNKGISPIYANWDIEFGVQNSSNQFQSLGFTKWDIDLIQPDNDDNYRSYISDTALADGVYTFLMRIVNSLESISPNAKAVSFANK